MPPTLTHPSCIRRHSGKMRFPSEEMALAAIDGLKAKRTERRSLLARLEAYHCHGCGYWFVGHGPKKKAPAS